ncbi:MAG: long-chain fatty acid--CoA ligase [Sorangiineae bacterium]|nr:long-chain fatty acid--CoA ligase [Polyangiaceae bacterium]MEB2321534.1 long-chain fatty acid--CoA ligase [Sorangiineae bacterium]
MSEAFTNLVELCDRSCEKHAERELFGTKHGSQWKWLSYGDFKTQVDQFRGALAALGVGAGDKVGIIANNRVEWAVAAYATYGLGAAFVPMYEAQLPKEWKFILEDCTAKICIGATPAIYAKLKELAAELPALEHVIGLELDESEPESYRALLARGERNPVPAKQPSSGDTAGFIYTSGTTGNPKGVILSHGNITSNINAVHTIFTFDSNDRSLSFLPWAHSFGQTCELHALLSMGCSMAINDDVANLVGNLADVRPTILFAVPRIFNRIYDGVNKQMAEKPGVIQNLFRSGIATATRKSAGGSGGVLAGMGLALADKLIFSKIRLKFGGRLRYAISGSAALSKEVAEFIDALGIEVYEGYGLTETSPIATANYPGHRKIGSVGKAIPEVTIKIDKAATGDDKHGEIVIYGPNIMQGYHNRPDENEKVLLPDGGFRSGDMGYLDADGYLYITGRIKEQYKLENGKYVVPAPLEEELKLSPYIANVMIHGANKPYNVALVVLDAESVKKWGTDNTIDIGADLAASGKVRELIKQELETRSKGFKGFERPQKFMLVTEDFTTDNGMLTPTLKLKRRNVLAKYEADLDRLY